MASSCTALRFHELSQVDGLCITFLAILLRRRKKPHFLDIPLLKTVLSQCTSVDRSETKERQGPLHLTELSRRITPVNAKLRKTNFHMQEAHIKTSSVQWLLVPESHPQDLYPTTKSSNTSKYEHETAKDCGTLQKHKHELRKDRKKPRTAFV